MDRTTLGLTALALSSAALSLAPLAAAQDPGPLVGDVIKTVTDTGRYAAETAFDFIDGLAPTIVGLINAVMDRVDDARGLVDRLNDEVVTPVRENLVCVVQDLVTRCDD